MYTCMYLLVIIGYHMDTGCEDYVEMKSAVPQAESDFLQKSDATLTDLLTELTHPLHQGVKAGDVESDSDQSSESVQALYQVPVKSWLSHGNFAKLVSHVCIKM